MAYASTKCNITVSIRSDSLRSKPGARYLIWGLIVPALLPIGVFALNIKAVPFSFVVFILVFSSINPYFEEKFWRGLLHHLPTNNKTKFLYSSALFSFSHYFLWGAYWLADSRKWVPSVITTFVMGMLWMWFFDKQKNLLYPMISHFFVDVFNLSVAVFYGLKLVTI
jgi:membrane protease YdiL (CAAX protease family)